MINEYLFLNLGKLDVDDIWFQQDEVTCHTSTNTIDLLKLKCYKREISRMGSLNWPSRSCDITPFEYFLWGYVKSLVYMDKPTTMDGLEDNAR